MAKVLIIGLDGATWRVLEPWARNGRLPNLAVLMARGSWGPLRSTVPALTLPAWSSLATGRNPGGHGVFAFRRLRPDRYDSPGLASASDLRAPTLWEIAGRAGVRVGVVNVPPSYPIRPVNGFVVSCLLTPPGSGALASFELHGAGAWQMVRRLCQPRPGSFRQLPEHPEPGRIWLCRFGTPPADEVVVSVRLLSKHMPTDALSAA